MNRPGSALSRILWLTAFGIGFGFVESSVVVYLRSLYYPSGFTLPLRLMAAPHLRVEVLREFATIAMLVSVAFLAGRQAWERFGFFLLSFGVWDIFYYVWLKVLLGWPASLLDWDVLFLIPVPWIGPVVVPVLLSVLMVLVGCLISLRLEAGRPFRPRVLEWGMGIAASFLVVFTFIADTDATLHGASPRPYDYLWFAMAMVLYVVAFLLACRSSRSGARSPARGR